MGMLVPSVAYYWPPVFTRAQSAAASLGHKLSLRCSGYGAVVEDRRQITRLLESGARGLILAPTLAGPGSKELARWIHALPVPIVLIERTLATVSPAYLADSVSTDHELGTGLAVRHLAGQGHTRIGLLTSDGSPTSVKVRRGWLKALEELGLPEIADSHQSAPSSDVRTGYAKVIDVLRERKLTAIVVHSDPEAIALMQHADEAGIRIPHDLAVVSYDDEVASASDPPLTAVRPPKAEIGALAVEMLVARMIQGESRPIHTTALTPRLIVRESCGASPLLAPSAN